MPKYLKIDPATGNYLEDVIINADPPDDPNLIATDIPQDAGFFLPRWDRAAKVWKEGLTVAEITARQSRPSPNWDAFFVAAIASPAYARIALQSSLMKQRTVTRLEILLGKRPTSPTQYQLLKKLWDDAVNGAVPALTAAEVAELNQVASQNFMPFSIAADGTMRLI